MLTVFAPHRTNSTRTTLEQPLRIAITKTPVYAVYPLVYQRNFNYAPSELLLSVPNCKVRRNTSFACPAAKSRRRSERVRRVRAPQDGAYQPDVTCGWFLDTAGNRIPESQARQPTTPWLRRAEVHRTHT